MIKLFDVDFGVRRYDYFAFKLERGHNNKNDIINLANSEGLHSHADSVKVRFKN